MQTLHVAKAFPARFCCGHAGVPYIIRPYHLPPSLTHLDLTNAAFAAAEWAQMAGLGNSIANSTTSSSNLPGPAGTDGSSRGPGHSGESGAGAQEAERGCGSSGGAEAPAAGEQLPLLPPRLVTLRLTHKRPRGARRRAVSSAGGGESGAVSTHTVSTAPHSKQVRPHLCDEHEHLLTCCQPGCVATP